MRTPVTSFLTALLFAVVVPVTNLQAQTYIIKTIAGNGSAGFTADGIQATASELNGPYGLAIDDTGNVYIADAGNQRIRKVSHTGIITTLAGNGTFGFAGDGSAATTAEFANVSGIALGDSGSYYVTDQDNDRVRKINNKGIISTYAGDGFGATASGGFSGDGGQATAAELNYENGIATDDTGNVYIADYENRRIRKVNKQGVISTYAGGGSTGNGFPATSAGLGLCDRVAVDDSGNLYICNFSQSLIQKVYAKTGLIYIIAGTGSAGFTGDGSPATGKALNQPRGVAVDKYGYVYIADNSNYRIRRVSPAGAIATIAGTGANGFSGDGSSSTAAKISASSSIAVDDSGNVYFSDMANVRVRKLEVIPAVPDTVLGVLSTCQSTAETYSITAVPWALSYTWTLPSGWSGTSTTNTINVTTGTTGGTISVTANSAYGSSVAKTLTVIVNPPTTSSLTIASCDSIVVNAQKYTTSGVYTQHTINKAGCDSAITLNLTVTNSTTSSLTQSSCDSILVNAVKYTTTGTYMQHITNKAGCDSAITLHLTVTNSTTASLTRTACDSYTLNSLQYTSSGTYMQHLTNKAGCDSTLTLNLTINKADTSVTETGNVLTANATAATYQWLTCGTSYTAISGETSSVFTVTSNGNYAVAVTQTGCTDTSTCYSIITTGINSYTAPTNDVTVYPLPSNGNFAITFNGSGYKAVTIYDETGRHIMTMNLNANEVNKTVAINMAAYANGIYYAQVLTNHGIVNKKILIQR